MSMYAITVGDTHVRYDDVACAGAICSWRWNGREFLDTGDDGRLLQSALTCDDDEENYNPTEGGSLHSIGFANPSDSLCIEHEKGVSTIRTVNRMAFWKPVDGIVLSDFILAKHITVTGQCAVFDLKMSTPASKTRAKDKWEILTGYMPPVFSSFFALDREQGRLAKLSDGPGEQNKPVILSTPDGQYAMGVLVPAWGDTAAAPANGYGRWRFPDCVKWNCVTRIANPAPGAVHTASVQVAWGCAADVVNALSTPLGVMAGQVRRLYVAALDRAPDDGGMEFQLAQLQAGMPLTNVAAGFVASAEFQSKYGNADDTAFVTLLYRNVLARDPDAEGLQFQLGQLAAGRLRAQLVVDFSESPEHQVRRLLADA